MEGLLDAVGVGSRNDPDCDRKRLGGRRVEAELLIDNLLPQCVPHLLVGELIAVEDQDDPSAVVLGEFVDETHYFFDVQLLVLALDVVEHDDLVFQHGGREEQANVVDRSKSLVKALEYFDA